MPHIYATVRPVYWAVGNPLVATGIMEEAGVTLTGLALYGNEDENDFLLSLITGSVSAPALPATGTWIEQGDIYDYSGTLYMVRQSHTRTMHDPATVPALFLYYQAGQELEWVVGEQAYVGTQRWYDGTLYQCLQAHVTQIDWTPPQVLGVLWAVVSQTAEWAAGVAYVGDNEAGSGNGDVVTYSGSEYRCWQSHTSQIGWEPPNVPALWIAL